MNISNNSHSTNSAVNQLITEIIGFTIPILTVLGFIGNALTFAVFCRKKFEKISFCFYFKVMTISDTLVLADFCYNWAYRGKSNFVKAPHNSFKIFCKLKEFTYWIASSSSAWLLTLIALDRMLTIVFLQGRFKLLRKRKFQILFCSIVIIGCICLYITQSINFKLFVLMGFNNKTAVSSFTTMCSI
jgi:hypothetical protein